MLSLSKCLFLVWYFSSLKVFAVQPSITMSLKDDKENTVNVKVQAVGCFGDAHSPRALRNMYFNARGFYAPDGSKTTDVIKACAENAYERGYKVVFGIQYYGECWSDDVAEGRYNMYGVSSSCEHGVGKGWANMVYRITVIPKSPVEGCNINGKEYSKEAEMMIPNDWSSNVYDSKCMKCICSGGQAMDCQVQMFCETGYEGLCSRWRNATGECCPVCDCYHEGKPMEVGSTWVVREGPRCSECTCGANNIAKCTNQQGCICTDGYDAIPVPGKCCPECVPKKSTTTTSPPPETIPTTKERPPPTFPIFV
ncbi:uncharacterized protein LOC116287168 isoform X2 [Actinia tenebrosa]|uniref:Uncharacterized protein LOC116287168 isoform X2 n=1 Tax=Actinia tenebrosa TaxID=6105 RepID=A0A6P8H2M5_ACTTE|nr:uncharacterized protein LOC116287168 isoform X2 [Actinia tenebrosa]